MRATLIGCILGMFWTPGMVQGGEPTSQAGVERFEKKVRPLLAAKCWSCHGAEKNKGGLRLHSAGEVAKGGDSGAVLIAGKPEESPLIEAIRYESDLKMPPKGKLSDAEILELTEWVRSGAIWPEPDAPKPVVVGAVPASTERPELFWAFQPVKDPTPPTVEALGWPSSGLDPFILSALEAKKLAPSPPASKRSLIRRATFDLIGLPPTTEEIDTFLADDTSNAFAKVIDRLLASPRYGERWGRHWLDLARYADSNGMDENVGYANAYRYRDYVVAAFNKDTPYDQFVKEQIAGDLITPAHENATNFARTTATGFLVLGPKMLAEDDPAKMEMDIIDEQVDTVGRVFMGLTIGCARCHDHKFDPIPTADYYSLAGIFKSTKSMANHKVVAMWNERPLASKVESEASAVYKTELARREKELKGQVDEARKSLRQETRSNVGQYLVAGWQWDQTRQLRQSVLATATGEPPVGTVIREAESFNRGNVLIDTTHYGLGIGVILNKGELPNFVEYDVDLPEKGVYVVELRHTAQEARPVRLLIDGMVIESEVAGEVTGSWGPEKQTWSAAGIIAFTAGRHIVRLDREGAFPHIDKLALVPRTMPEGLELASVKTAEEIGKERKLNPRLIEHWGKVLVESRKDLNSIFRGLTDRAALEGDLKTAIERDPTPTQPQMLADRYQQLFDESARADAERRKSDPILAAFQTVLDDPNGPFRLGKNADKFYSPETSELLKKGREEIATFMKTAPAVADAMAVEDQKAADMRIHIRGNHVTLGEEVPRRFPWVLADKVQTPIDSTRSGRLELAEWLAKPDHPLTARVMVNRIWQGHFGEGLLRSPDNFGHLGERPDHPALLDWLASRFVESGWSIKAMHRLVMLSSTYQMNTRYDEKSALADPENRLLWRMPRRRLEAEAIRDAILAVSGELDTAMGGTFLTTKNHAYVNDTGRGGGINYDLNRRSIYLPVIRSGLYDVFQAFDFADPSGSNGKRIPTTVAPQALFMMNDKLVLRCSEAMARRLLADQDTDTASRVKQAYLAAYGRPATAGDIERATEYLGRFTAILEEQGVAPEARPLRSWQVLCQSILASSEFLYLD